MDPNALLKEYFGFDDFRPGQRAVIDAIDRDGAALAVFPTGGGKSVCYQLSALRYEGVTVVVSPLIALMKDQIDFLTRRGIGAARLDSSVTPAEQNKIIDGLENGRIRLLYVAPERFNNERFLSLLRRLHISLFAVDEAHCISEWGHNFRPDYLKLAETAREVGAERVLALTATATPSVVEDICKAFCIPPDGSVVTGFYRPNLDIVTSEAPTASSERSNLLVSRIASRPAGSTIVYVTLQKTAEEVARFLEREGYPAKAYHAGLDADLRSSIQDWWMHSDSGIVVATIAFGMGIDKSDVRYIYHYNLPKSLESYSQEIGRAGRDGNRSTVEILVCGADLPALENFAYGDTPTREALLGMVSEIVNGPEEFDVNLYELSQRHDIRQLVLRTALTYLELAGLVKQGTPFYAGYEIKLNMPVEDVIAKFKGEPAQLVADVFANARKGRIWYALNPDDMAELLGKERRRIVRCIEYLEEHGWAEARASDARMRFTLLSRGNANEIADELYAKFERREKQEVARVHQVFAVASSAPCVTNALAAHFGEIREQPCGHCSSCLEGPQMKSALPPRSEKIPETFPKREWQAVRIQAGSALTHPRNAAKFLCGLSSPGLTRAKLTRHALFGSLETVPFHAVLRYCDVQ